MKSGGPRIGRLSPRECEIRGLLKAGMSPTQIARQLGITLGTVKLHQLHARQKLFSKGERIAPALPPVRNLSRKYDGGLSKNEEELYIGVYES